MSTTTLTMTLPPTTKMTTTTTTTRTTPCCPNCGLNLPPNSTSTSASDPQVALLQAQKQIDDLQAQVRLLNQKASAAVDRWADYEDELSKLRAAAAAAANSSTTTTTTLKNPPSNHHQQQRPMTPTPSLPSTSSPRTSFLGAGVAASSRLSQLLLLSPRRSTPPVLASSSSVPPSPSADDLLSELERERELRAAAEGKLSDTSREVEELSVTLFEQANEMVATERRARARLEERVGVLERRDVEKRDRLDRLEGAMGRLERVRVLLGEGK
ncbi:hypothetical protein F4778DRAFT_781793 [Xylariomycetidae sp. FL2044]|nr:hypothetical protein F4778DRAFT_781793 [Xylariomycetidae sp. FL2044]